MFPIPLVPWIDNPPISTSRTISGSSTLDVSGSIPEVRGGNPKLTFSVGNQTSQPFEFYLYGTNPSETVDAGVQYAQNLLTQARTDWNAQMAVFNASKTLAPSLQAPCEAFVATYCTFYYGTGPETRTGNNFRAPFGDATGMLRYNQGSGQLLRWVPNTAEPAKGRWIRVNSGYATGVCNQAP